MATRTESRSRRKKRIRKKVAGTGDQPRLTIFRSNKHIYAQVVDDLTAASLAAASSVGKKADNGSGDEGKRGVAKAVGAAIAKACQDKGIKSVVFDRNGYAYHGRVSALADAAREAGLEF